MKKLLTSVVISTLILTGCQNAQPKTDKYATQQQTDSIQTSFQKEHINGVITIYDGYHFHSYGSNTGRATQQYIPASTFKMLNALIALEHHKTTTIEVFKWDGQKRAFAAWEKDMTMQQAIQASAVPVYQEIARRIGLDLMQSEVKRIGFGNQDIGTQVDNFWLVGPLQISPQQEARFAYQLATEQLAFSKEAQQHVKNMLLLENKQGYKLYAKSGWGVDVQPMVGWLTGWVEQPNGKVMAFALNIEMDKDTPLAIRKQLAISSLQTLQLYP